MASKCKPSNKRLGLIWANQYVVYGSDLWTYRSFWKRVLVQKGTLPPDINWDNYKRKLDEPLWKQIREMFKM